MAELISLSFKISGGTWFRVRADLRGAATTRYQKEDQMLPMRDAP